jgi:ubiquinone/menaquinone biosynthesis C-methylase UbiE
VDESPVFAGTAPEIIARRAASFGSQAAAYAQARPDYPAEAVRWALAPVADRKPLRVLDLGAGTGKLTGVLRRELPADADLVAVEPDPAMLAEFRRHFPKVRSEPGTAEKIPLPSASVDAILVGQALHWFDLEKALPEMARVLTGRGVVAGLWNLDDDRLPWVSGLKEVARSQVSFSRWKPGEIQLDQYGSFATPERATFPHSQRRTAQSMVETIATHSQVLILDEPERRELLGRVLAYLRSVPETSEGEFDLPIITTVIRTGLLQPPS